MQENEAKWKALPFNHVEVRQNVTNAKIKETFQKTLFPRLVSGNWLITLEKSF